MKLPKPLENITEEQAQHFVDEDMARFSGYNDNQRAILVFNETKNVYHKSANRDDYVFIGIMGRAVLPNEDKK